MFIKNIVNTLSTFIGRACSIMIYDPRTFGVRAGFTFRSLRPSTPTGPDCQVQYDVSGAGKARIDLAVFLTLR